MLSSLWDNKRITANWLSERVPRKVQQPLSNPQGEISMRRYWYHGLITVEGTINSEAELRQLKIDLETAMEQKHSIMLTIVDHKAKSSTELVSTERTRKV